VSEVIENVPVKNDKVALESFESMQPKDVSKPKRTGAFLNWRNKTVLDLSRL